MLLRNNKTDAFLIKSLVEELQFTTKIKKFMNEQEKLPVHLLL